MSVLGVVREKRFDGLDRCSGLGRGLMALLASCLSEVMNLPLDLHAHESSGARLKMESGPV